MSSNSSPSTNGRSRDEAALRAILRSDFEAFIRKCFNTLNPGTLYLPNWHIAAIAHRLEQVRLGKTTRLIITMPPRSLKSISASIAFPAFLLGHDPTLSIVSATYGQDLSEKFHNDCRRILSEAWFQELFPGTRIDQSKNTSQEVLLTARGSRFATSVGGVLTGRGADVVIIDDPLKPDQAMSVTAREKVNDWFRTTLLSRLNNKNTGAIVIVTQRLHTNDLVGELLGQDDHGEWDELELPAIAIDDQFLEIGEGRYHHRKVGDVLHPEREGKRILDEIRINLGSDVFNAQYQQRPVPPGGAMFKRDWVRRYDNITLGEPGDTVIQSWDTASKTGPANDWSVGTTWLFRKNQYYLIEVRRGKWDYPTLKEQVRQLARAYNPRIILIEDMGIGTGLISEIREFGLNVDAIRPTQSKEARASVQSGKFEGGRVLFPEKASWLSELEAELFAFPGSQHDDQVDSIVQALAYEHVEEGTVHTGWIGRPPGGCRRRRSQKKEPPQIMNKDYLGPSRTPIPSVKVIRSATLELVRPKKPGADGKVGDD